MKYFHFILVLTAFICFSTATAQTYQSGATVINNGQSLATSASYQSQAVVGQAIVGTVSSANFNTTTGFVPASLSVQLVDVTIENIALNPSTIGPGGSLAFSFDIQSLENGNIEADVLLFNIYLSTDQTIDTGELIKTITIVNNISGNSTYAYPLTGDDATVTIPTGTASGNYYLIFELDPSNTLLEVLEDNNTVATAIIISDDTIDPVIGTLSKDNYYVNGSTASVAINDNVGVTKVNFYHRGIRTVDTEGWGTPIEVAIASGLYTVTLEASWLDELGVEYWFEALDAVNNRDSTAVNYTFAQTVGGELTLPAIPAGAQQRNYQIISIPFELTQKNATTVFSKLGAYDPTKWRMYHYLNGSTKEYNQGWSSIELGKSYWIIHNVPDAGQILIGEGKATQSNKTAPYTIDLIQGWNQVGNPYRFDVNWSDVLTANGTPAEVERFRVWNAGSFADGTNLKSFGGGFVFTSAPVSITIPVTATTTGGRIANTPKPNYPLDNANWQVRYQLTNDDLTFNFGGFGMHQDALAEKDVYDDVAMPRLSEYVDINFKHPEYFIPTFSKDIVPTTDTHTWYFTVDKNSSVSTTTLTWNNSYFGSNSKELILFDLERNIPVDMREKTSYTFSMANSYGFKVIYGNEAYVEQALVPSRIILSQNYPNPFSSTTFIPFSLPDMYDSYGVELIILNKLGQQVKHLLQATMAPGYYEIEWKGLASTGQEATPGLYVYQLRVNTGEELLSYTKNIIIY